MRPIQGRWLVPDEEQIALRRKLWGPSSSLPPQGLQRPSAEHRRETEAQGGARPGSHSQAGGTGSPTCPGHSEQGPESQAGRRPLLSTALVPLRFPTWTAEDNDSALGLLQEIRELHKAAGPAPGTQKTRSCLPPELKSSSWARAPCPQLLSGREGRWGGVLPPPRQTPSLL